MVILKLAIATLWENKLRSFLTLLGMIFGNAAVIATLSSNEGAKIFIAKQLESLGNKLMTVEIGSNSIKESDLVAIRTLADEIDLSTRDQNFGSGTSRFRNTTLPVQLRGAEPEYFKIMNLELASGRGFTRAEIDGIEPVAIIGHRVRTTLFQSNSFVNEFITVATGSDPVLIRVIGSFREKGGPAGTPLDGSVFVSPNFGRKVAARADEKLIALLKDDNRSTMAKYQLTSLLAPRFGSNMQIADARESIEKTNAIWAKQNFVGMCLAVISLLTGGIGIMNIMLLSIHQRQKEIGLRKAVGAQNSEIAMQFLLETVIICLIGGVIGIIVGWGFGQQVARMLGSWEATMTLSSMLMALGFSVLTGVAFGAAPAMRAARIDPYDALRTG